MPPAAISISAPVAEPPFETRPEIVAPLVEEPGDAGEGCAASGIDGELEELHATAVTSPTTTAVSRKESGAVMKLVLVVRAPAREPEEATSPFNVRKLGAAVGGAP